ncbi:guanine nucleotide-binding protein subunit gamma 1-like [Typha latifolia]|uniref:guanine nucleotide-binding protein subunit gamma 1-like n=1 Tax=Typha latifolia TaxID=4733 RepID=UPI003C2ECB56
MQANRIKASSSVELDGGNLPETGDIKGKHRIQAEVKRFEQEARFLEQELQELEKTEKVSAALEEFLRKVESRPDPFLPVTTGPANQSWDRWFEGPKEHGCKCRIL